MKLDQLLYFLEVAKQGHLGRASQILSLSPSAVSHSLSSLERDLGVQLFERNKKQLILTQRGRILVDRAKPLIGEFERLKEEVKSGEAPLVGHFVLGATHFLSGNFLSPSWSQLSEQHTRLSCDLTSATSAQIVSRTSLGELDFGLCFSPNPNPMVEEECLLNGELGVVVRKDHPLLKSKKNFWDSLKDYRAILPKASQGIDNCQSHPALEKQNVKMKSHILVDSYESIVGSVQGSNVWSLVPDVIAAVCGLSFIKPTKSWGAPYKISAVWPKNRLKTQLIADLIESIKKQLIAVQSKQKIILKGT
jgi:DNA-binding transcriptional LysR family regulator